MMQDLIQSELNQLKEDIEHNDAAGVIANLQKIGIKTTEGNDPLVKNGQLTIFLVKAIEDVAEVIFTLKSQVYRSENFLNPFKTILHDAIDSIREIYIFETKEQDLVEKLKLQENRIIAIAEKLNKLLQLNRISLKPS